MMELDHLDARILLRFLRDPRVETIAIEHYAAGELHELIQEVQQIVASANSQED